GGEAGIRTLGTTLRSYNGLANRRLQPLGHLTVSPKSIIIHPSKSTESVRKPEHRVRLEIASARRAGLRLGVGVMKWFAAVLLTLILLPSYARGQRANSPADATVFIRLVGSVHVEIDEVPVGGVRRVVDVDHVEISSGSGFVISPYGHILTNQHVIANVERMLTGTT